MDPKKISLLVVDSNRVSRKVYGKLLVKHFEGSCTIREADSGQGGLELCQKKPVDCLIIDYSLPDIDGLEFLNRLKNDLNYPFVPVIILTGHRDEISAVQAMKSGAQDYLVKGTFSQQLLGQAVSNAIEKVELLKELEQKRIDLTRTNSELLETNQRLKETQQQLIDSAHKAGMAEIATGVLHNIGNILNSVNTSVEILQENLQRTKLSGLKRANRLLESMNDQIVQHPKGAQLIEYYQFLEGELDQEHVKINKETVGLLEKIKMIRDDILAQKRFANAEFMVEQANIAQLITHAIQTQAGLLEKNGVVIDQNLDPNIICNVVRIKLVHVITILLKNCQESLMSRPAGERLVEIELFRQDQSHVQIVVRDNGEGIPKINLEKIFNYGFSTRKGAQGIGLHVAANAMTEMQGSLNVESQPDAGAAFILILPASQS